MKIENWEQKIKTKLAIGNGVKGTVIFLFNNNSLNFKYHIRRPFKTLMQFNKSNIIVPEQLTSY